MTSRRLPALLAGAALLALTAAPAGAQSNQIPGIDVSLGALKNPGLQVWGRVGDFPNGTIGVSMSTTSCNLGSVGVPFVDPASGVMDPDHPFIAFLVAREAGGRMEQVSNRSNVKHGFCALSSSDCQTCTAPLDCTVLAVGCSDTYSVFNNGDQFWLGPANEIDPWLGTWDPVCSYFDMGVPAAAPPQDCDGVRSLVGSQINGFTPVQGRMQLRDEDLMAGGSFWYQAQYVIEGEPEAKRGNNLGTRPFTVGGSDGNWTLTATGGLSNGTVLQHWTGATLRGGKNGEEDGLVYAAVRVTGPVGGLYHYEYALHNRDNSGGIGAFHLPTCAEAQVSNPGFRDVDQEAGNDWTFTRTSTEIVFATTGNPLEWNTIYNFWFDSDAAPSDATATLDQLTLAPGAAASFGVGTKAPTRLDNVFLGAGCSDGTPPSLYAADASPQATLGNAVFALESASNDPGGFVVFLLDLSDGTIPLGGGCNYYGGALQPFVLGDATADGAGVAGFPLPIPGDPTIEGAHLNAQVVSLRAGGGPLLGSLDVSNGLRVRIGDTLPACP